MKKILLLFFLFLIIASTTQARIGFGPSEIYSSNKRETTVIGTATLINDNNYAQHGVFSLFLPYTNIDTYRIVETEVVHARVMCPNCKESYQRHEVILGYEYGDLLEAKCPGCSGDLRFYEPLPRDELEYFSLEGADNFDLIPIENSVYMTWITKQKIEAGGACTINVLYDASKSYLKENIGQHWELHLRGTVKKEIDITEDMVVGGLDIRVLISFKFPLFLNVPYRIEIGENFTVKVTYGNPKGTWRDTPEDVFVIFNGVEKPIDNKGYVSFTVPETRKDYEYTIEAVGDNYLPIKKTLKTGVNPDGNDDMFLGIIPLTLFGFLPTYIFIIIVVIAIVGIWFIIKIL